MPLNTPVVPGSISSAKRTAKKLHQIYSRKALSECQAVTAHLFGHKDWHALEEAVKHSMLSAPFDEDLADDEYSARLTFQYKIVCRELGDTDPEDAYLPPNEPESKSVLTEQELQAHVLAKAAQLPTRERQAVGRYMQLLAQETISVVAPTAARPVASLPCPDGLTICTHERMARLPVELARWWRYNIAWQPVVADTLETIDYAPDDRLSILQFSDYWGALCFHYARTIDWTMGMGVAYLLAERFAWLKAIEHPSVGKLSSASKYVTTPEEKQALGQEVERYAQQQMVRFFCGFRRDDFALAFQGQPEAFLSNAREVLKILDKPQSTKGIWRNQKLE